MSTIGWTITGLFVVIFALLFLVSFRDDFAERRALRFTDEVGMRLTESSAVAVIPSLMRQFWASAAGGGIALLLTAVTLSIAGSDPDAEVLLLIGGAFAGLVIGLALSSLVRPANTPGVRVARTRAVSLADYVPRYERYLARAIVAVGLVVSLALPALAPSAEGRFPLWTYSVLAVLALLSLVLFEVAGRRIISRGQVAAYEIELAWDDALRSYLVRGMLAAPVGLATIAIVLSIFDSIEPPPVVAAWIILFFPLQILAYAVGHRLKAAQHVLRRLWPTLNARVSEVSS